MTKRQPVFVKKTGKMVEIDEELDAAGTKPQTMLASAGLGVTLTVTARGMAKDDFGNEKTWLKASASARNARDEPHRDHNLRPRNADPAVGHVSGLDHHRRHRRRRSSDGAGVDVFEFDAAALRRSLAGR